MFASKKARILSWLLLALCVIGTSVYFIMTAETLLDADMSSDMVHAQQVIVEGAPLTRDWYYSTEIRVVHLYLLFAPLLTIFSDWTLVRIVGTLMWHGVLLASVYYFCRQAKMKHGFALAGVLVMLPISSVQHYYLLRGAYYLPAISGAFWVFGIILQCSRMQKRGATVAVAAVGALLSLAQGLGGMRMLVVFYIPISIAAGLMWMFACRASSPDVGKLRRLAWHAWLQSAVAFVGCAINVLVLPQYYAFRDYDDLNFIFVFLDRLLTMLQDWLASWGYRAGPIFSLTLVYNLVALALIVGFIAAVVRTCRGKDVPVEQRVLSLFYGVGMLVFAAMLCCTSMGYAAPYQFPIDVFGMPLVAGWLCSLKKRWQHALCWIVAVALVICGGLTYADDVKLDQTQEWREIAEYLVEEGYQAGYSQFWTPGNMLTELTDGKVEMYLLSREDSADINQTYQWLQRKSHDTQPPQGRVCVIIPRNDLGSIALSPKLSYSDMWYETDNYLVYGYDDYDTMLECMKLAEEEYADFW